MKSPISEIKSFISAKSNIPVEELGDKTLLLASGIIRSLALLELIAFLERSFSIEIDQSDMIPEHFVDISSLGDLVSRIIATNAKAAIAK